MLEAIALIAPAVVVILAGLGVKAVQQYEEGIVFRFGRVLPRTRRPGLTWIWPVVEKLEKVNKQIVAMAVPALAGITRDNISVRVDAVVIFKVVDVIKAKTSVENYVFAVSQRAQNSLRSIIGQSDMDELLSDRERVGQRLCRVIGESAEAQWGVKVERAEIKDVSLQEP